MEAFFMQKGTMKVIVPAVDLNDGANTGERIDMSKCERVTFHCHAKAGTTPNAHSFSFQQHTVASAGSPANLEIDNPYWHKVNAATVFTKVKPGAKAASFDLDTLLGDTKFEVVFEVLAEDLTDGYRWVSINLADTGGAQLGAIVAVCHGMKNDPGADQAV